jgi:elongation factor Ts
LSTAASYQPTTDDIKKLREETTAPMMDCRKVLIESNGDFEKAKTLLRERGAAKAGEKEERKAEQGLVASYIHAGGKIGVLVEVNSETDFVARNPQFGELARDIAMHVAAMSPEYLDRACVPADVLAQAIEELKATVPPGKPPEVSAKIVEGKLNKWYEERVLLDQRFVKDDALSINDLVNRAVGTLGEKIVVRRFAKFTLGDK